MKNDIFDGDNNANIRALFSFCELGILIFNCIVELFLTSAASFAFHSNMKETASSEYGWNIFVMFSSLVCLAFLLFSFNAVRTTKNKYWLLWMAGQISYFALISIKYYFHSQDDQKRHQYFLDLKSKLNVSELVNDKLLENHRYFNTNLHYPSQITIIILATFCLLVTFMVDVANRNVKQ
jgi:hypothetical protein